MKENYLNEAELEWSPTVANNAMNRKRVAFGINSYEKAIKLNPIDFLRNRQKQEHISWADLCCGEGNALIQTAQYLQSHHIGGKWTLIGIDLVNFFADSSNVKNVQFIQQNLTHWKPNQTFDLISIVHGLHYIGDKISLILKAIASLKQDGLFIGNLDLNNIVMEGQTNSKAIIKQFFKAHHIAYNSRTKIISAIGGRKIHNPFAFLGANDQAGPNYTGQNSVDSVYRFNGSTLEKK